MPPLPTFSPIQDYLTSKVSSRKREDTMMSIRFPRRRAESVVGVAKEGVTFQLSVGALPEYQHASAVFVLCAEFEITTTSNFLDITIQHEYI